MTDIKNLKTIKYPCIIYIYSPNCRFCNDFTPVFKKLKIDKARTLMYNILNGTPQFSHIPIETVPHILFKIHNYEMKYLGLRNPTAIKVAWEQFVSKVLHQSIT